MSGIRQPAVAGRFYPAEARRLRQMVTEFLAAAKVEETAPKAMIAPHAGYVYSGAIAATAFASVAAGRENIKRVLLLGPAHRVPVRGVAASSAAAFATPLGEVPVDRVAVRQVLAHPWVCVHDEAHAPEHGLEVHLPFLQVILGEFSMVPLVVGEASPQQIAGILSPFAADDETLIVVSSDLSHYHPYEAARRLDRETSAAIEALCPLRAGQACGRNAINGLLHLARQQGWQARTVDLRSSGDTGGPRHQVVGYGAYLFR